MVIVIPKPATDRRSRTALRRARHTAQERGDMGAYRSTRHPGTARVPERKVRASQNGSHESWGSRTPVRRGDPRPRGRAGLRAGVARCERVVGR